MSSKLYLKFCRLWGEKTVERFFPIFTYCVIGGINTVVSFSLFTLFWKLFYLNYLAATSYTYVICACIQFFGNRKVTFKNSSGNLLPQIIKYLVMLASNYLITMFIMHFVVSFLKLSPYIGMITATISTAINGFFLFKFWIFKHHL